MVEDCEGEFGLGIDWERERGVKERNFNTTNYPIKRNRISD